MARSNGGIIGKVNKASFGKCVQTVITSPATHTTNPGTTLANVLVIGGGGSGKYGPSPGNNSGGGGAGGLVLVPELSVCTATGYPVV